MRGWHGLCCLHGLINWYHIVENSMDINQEDEYKCYTKACEMFHLAVLLSLYQVHIVVASYDYFLMTIGTFSTSFALNCATFT